MQFTTPDMREITISDKSEACDFIKDSCKECNRKYECTGENAAFCNHMKNILVAKYGAAEGCLKESRIRHSMGVANFLFAYAKSHDCTPFRAFSRGDGVGYSTGKTCRLIT